MNNLKDLYNPRLLEGITTILANTGMRLTIEEIKQVMDLIVGFDEANQKRIIDFIEKQH